MKEVSMSSRWIWKEPKYKVAPAQKQTLITIKFLCWTRPQFMRLIWMLAETIKGVRRFLYQILIFLTTFSMLQGIILFIRREWETLTIFRITWRINSLVMTGEQKCKYSTIWPPKQGKSNAKLMPKSTINGKLQVLVIAKELSIRNSTNT